MKRFEIIYEIVDKADDEEIRDWAIEHLKIWNTKSLKEELEKRK